MNKKNNLIIATVFILIAAASRLLPHPPNFTPLGGMALFGAAYLGRKYWTLLIPLIAFLVSDFVLNNTLYSSYAEGSGIVFFTKNQLFTCVAFIAIALIGSKVLQRIKPINVLLASFIASALFFIISNLGVWMTWSIFGDGATGLLATYIAGIPFFWNTFAGDLFYTTALIGGFELYRYLQMKRSEVRV